MDSNTFAEILRRSGHSVYCEQAVSKTPCVGIRVELPTEKDRLTFICNLTGRLIDNYKIGQVREFLSHLSLASTYSIGKHTVCYYWNCFPWNDDMKEDDAA